MKCITPIILLAIFSLTTLFGQVPTIHDCLGAIPICKAIYTQESLPDGEGNYPNEINGVYDTGGWCCMDDEVNSVWYTFTANNDGNFGFVLTPNDLADDYDWALFDLTNATCEDIYDEESLNISCNAAGSNSGTACDGVTGPDGSEPYHFQGAGCNFTNPSVSMGRNPFNALVPVFKGNTYVLIVSNWKGQGGFTIDFSLSVNTGIIDEINPTIAKVAVPTDCGDDLINITFSENIQCATVIGSNFVMTGPGGPYTITLSSSLCDIGAPYTKEFEFQVSPPIMFAGEYEISILSPTDILDLCDNPVLSDKVASFITEESLALFDLGNDTIFCNEPNYVIDANTPGALAYLWQDGSDGATFNAMQSGNYAVTLEFAGGCFTTDDINLTFNTTGDIVNLGPDTLLCNTEPLVIDATVNGAIMYTWQDGSQNASYEVQTDGLYWVEVTLNGNCIERDSINVNYSNETQDLDIGPDQQICKPGTVTLQAELTNAVSYEWQDGSTASSLDVSEDGLYWVDVVFGDGCIISDSINLDFATLDIDVELGNDTILCDGNIFTIIPNTTNVETYVWQDASTSQQYDASTSGWYWLTVNAVDACPETDSIFLTFQSGQQPLDLGKDTIICIDQPYVLDATTSGASAYLWDDGSSDPTLLVENAGTYAVTVESIDCIEYVGSINISSQDCQPCDFFIPNVFTPNNDGKNDLLQPNISCNYSTYDFYVYNRWGSLVFRSSSEDVNWNGKYKGEEAEIGVYIYLLEYTYNDEMYRLSGDVSLLR